MGLSRSSLVKIQMPDSTCTCSAARSDPAKATPHINKHAIRGLPQWFGAALMGLIGVVGGSDDWVDPNAIICPRADKF